ncbi:MAG: thiamine-phosphate kinase [Candidatus Omnitrophica bacterium]|nr:thiamine-phosphate kinase [Candidatus Omnitrophota bacterium]
MAIPRLLHALGEVGLIARMRRRLHRDRSVIVGIGDDAAVLRAPASKRLLFASDMLVEGIHFRLPPSHHLPAGPKGRNSPSANRQVVGSSAGTEEVTKPTLIGWKALAANISDIAAMGGVPRWAVVSLGAPPSTPVAVVDRLYHGLERCARRFGVSIVGGDTVRAPQLIIDVAILGTVEPRHLTLRSTARVGDTLFVTGRLGGSLRSGRHAQFIPRLREAQALVTRVRVHAMMDLSDGLASDAWQLARASRVTLRIEAAAIPVAQAAGSVHHALVDGEDFELLFAVGARDTARVPARIGTCPVTRIGTVVRRGARVELQRVDGRITLLRAKGFQHF